jgi:heme exporter protein D
MAINIHAELHFILIILFAIVVFFPTNWTGITIYNIWSRSVVNPYKKLKYNPFINAKIIAEHGTAAGAGAGVAGSAAADRINDSLRARWGWWMDAFTFWYTLLANLLIVIGWTALTFSVETLPPNSENEEQLFWVINGLVFVYAMFTSKILPWCIDCYRYPGHGVYTVIALVVNWTLANVVLFLAYLYRASIVFIFAWVWTPIGVSILAVFMTCVDRDYKQALLQDTADKIARQSKNIMTKQRYQPSAIKDPF